MADLLAIHMKDHVTLRSLLKQWNHLVAGSIQLWSAYLVEDESDMEEMRSEYIHLVRASTISEAGNYFWKVVGDMANAS